MNEKVSKKQKVNLSIDPDIWELAKKRIPSVSQTVENLLKVLIDLEDANETRILQEITQTEEDIKTGHGKLLILRNQLETLRNKTRYNMQEKQEDIAWYQALNTYSRIERTTPEVVEMIKKAVPVLEVEYEKLKTVVEEVHFAVLDHKIEVMDSQSWKYVKEEYKRFLQ